MEITGVTYSVSHYEHYKKHGDLNYFEEIIDKMILDQVVGMNESFRTAIEGLSRDKKRMAILSILDRDRNLFKRIKALIDKDINRMDHIKDVILMLRDYVKVGEVEKKKFGEVMTPLSLVKEMLATLPDDVWTNPNLKWLDPANGTGPYPVMVIYKLMVGLKEWEPNDEKRYKHIVENMIYVSELQPKNMFLYMCAVDPFDTYKLNVYTGSFLEKEFDYHMKNIWNIEKFDIIIGNPPYQEQVGPKKTKSIWNLFVKKSISSLNDYGFITMVHPSGWRSLDGDFKDVQILIKRNLLYLEMHDDKDGHDMFGATTSYDWYCYSKITVKDTKIKDQKGKISNIDISSWEFIPAGEFDTFSSLISNGDLEKVNVIYSRSAYGTDKSHMSRDQVNGFIYPCVYTIVKDTTINLFWSNTNNNGHFGIPKVVWSNGMASPPTMDLTGQYGLTQFSYAIVDSVDNLPKIKQVMDSDKFIQTMKLCYMSSGNRFDRKVLSTFRKDFWKYFL